MTQSMMMHIGLEEFRKQTSTNKLSLRHELQNFLIRFSLLLFHIKRVLTLTQTLQMHRYVQNRTGQQVGTLVISGKYMVLVSISI